MAHQTEISNALFGKWVLDSLVPVGESQSERVEKAKKRIMTMRAKELIHGRHQQIKTKA